MSKIFENLQGIRKETGPARVRIIAVAKYVGISEILDAYENGLRDFAESKIQDALVKRVQLPEDIEKNIVWHFIGHLQTNKVKKVVGNFEYIHSVDSLKLAKCISEDARSKNLLQKVLIQVNVANENTKFGFGGDEIKEVFQEIIKLDSVKIVGLMTIAPNDLNVARSVFRELRELRNYLQEKFSYSLPELSMGMSNDYKIAVEEGSTMIRIGHALFK
jgi:PLP dependent protein